MTAVRPAAQRVGEALYRAADGASAGAFPRERRPLPEPIVIGDQTIDTLEDIGIFTGLGRDVAAHEVERRRRLSYRAEWYATPPSLRQDHWFYLSSKTYLFGNASHYTDSELLDSLTPHIPAGGQVLDFGGGSGELTLRLAGAGFQTAFVELNALQRDFVRFRIRRHNLQDLINVLDPWDDLPAGAFDAIAALDVIEHLPNPEHVLRTRLLPALKPEGILIDATPFESNAANPMHHDEDFGMAALMTEHGLTETWAGEPRASTRIWRPTRQ